MTDFVDQYDVIKPLLARLKEQCPQFPVIDHAWFTEPLTSFESQTPAVLVYLDNDSAEPDTGGTCVNQRVTLTYGIWIVCKQPVFPEARAAIREALCGQSFTRHHEAMQYVGGKANDIHGELIWWREYWSISTYRKCPIA